MLSERGSRGGLGERAHIVEHNMALAKLVYRELDSMEAPRIRLAEASNPPERMLVVSGNDIVAMGEVVGGLRVQTNYPHNPRCGRELQT
jgi:2-oxoglutarate ferredoxin oxidoreductase subunit alpha